MRDVPELGFALAARAHGKGYASEAVRAAIAYADAHLPAERTVCLINEDNAASIRVVQKAGYTVFERTLFNDVPTLFLERLQPAR
jgi:RimJ/RimL family protein N-acetyltransferase